MKSLKYFLITLLAAVSCCAISANAEEIENIPEETQVTEASEETTEPTEVTTEPIETTVSNVTEPTEPIVTNEDYKLKYNTFNDHIEIIGCDSRAENIIIPSEIDNLPVTAISSTAFYNNSRIKSIELPESITVIEEDTFYYCTSLESIKLPDSLTIIGKYAFYNCANLKSIELPESLKTIDDFAFGCCANLFDVKIADGLRGINAGAFYECKSLENIELPESVISIGMSAFEDCSGLKKITILNSKCDIYNQDNGEKTLGQNAIICSYNGSTALTYANRYKKSFEQIIVNQEENVADRELGDANNDGKVSISDAAFIAKKIAQRRSAELSIEYCDYNKDGCANIRDAASIAMYLAGKHFENSTRKNVIMNYLCPKKADYNFNNITGMKNYVNDYVRYYAHKKYGITAVAYDDKVDVWDYSWDVPATYVPDTEYYMNNNSEYGALEIGSIIYELPEQYKKDNTGWEQLFHIVKNKNEAVEQLVKEQCTALDMMVSEFKAQGHSDSIEHTEITLSWQLIGGGNYEVYMLWGAEKEFNFEDDFKKYYQLSNEVYEKYWKELMEWYYNEFGHY